jgi:hypothetical protein
MVGQGVLHECLVDDRVTAVLAVGRSTTGTTHPKLRELLPPDMYDMSSMADELGGYDACFWCLGVSSVGMTEAAYRKVTYDLTLSVATILAQANRDMTFVFVSGAGTDGTEQSTTFWRRVKGAAENTVLALPFKGFAMRPGFIRPMHGARSRTWYYALIYRVFSPLSALLVRSAPKFATTTERVGHAMLQLASVGSDTRVLESADINNLAALYEGRAR